MRFCPVCHTKYDEEIVKFCTKDGTPLVAENPSFTAMPSASSIDDIGEQTLIRMGGPTPPPIPEMDEPGQRIVIPTADETKQEVRPLERPLHQQQAPPKSNLGLVVFLTVFGTLIVIGGVFGIWWMLSGRGANAGNTNSNANANSNVYNANFNGLNSAANLNLNTNVNTNSNVNVNSNANANIKTPTPTKSPTPSPSPTFDENLNINTNTIVNISPSNANSSVNTRPSSTPAPAVSPKPTVTPTTPSQNVNVGIMNSRAVSLKRPAYPPAAKLMNASGEVSVQISIDEEGNVLSARAISGNALLRPPSEAAARQSRFYPVKLGEKAVRASGVVVYNFINQ